MRSSGFTAFVPWLSWRSSYCSSDEAELHALCQIEEIKEQITDPRPRGASPIFGDTQGYRSPLLSQLRDRRDRENGCSLEELRQTEGSSWKWYLDPCERRLQRSDDRGDTFQRARRLVAAEREKEASLHATRLAQVHRVHAPLPMRAAFREMMSFHFGDLGYRFTESAGTASSPLLAKLVAPGWLLCWANEEFDEGSSRTLDKLSLIFHLRPQNRGRLRAKAALENVLRLRIQLLVPGFHLYRQFKDSSELEVSIKANAVLFGLISSRIEQHFSSVLS